MIPLSIVLISLAFAWLLIETYLLGIRLQIGNPPKIINKNLAELIPPIVLAAILITSLFQGFFGGDIKRTIKSWWQKWWHQVKVNWGMI